ncbi:UDP-N-acetylmuramoyl-L-alanyl-D-glutamate--2,6-diaminopimelate ligase [Oscillospiraceae bacterium LTW-04]|nr:UDP-N-acetylmuramoyl-L-alanyl-D-glutamate--2,6-diaminopimelate ligase [Oscillospiraceae bacterium MB24-C1]
MRLSQLFNDVKIGASLPDIDVGHVCADTRQVAPGAVFFCLNGFMHDGHDYAKKALELGAAMVVAERDLGLGEQQILTPDTHEAYSICCANLFGNPQRKIKLVGVTGTNGKTTVTHLIRDVLEGFGYKTGLIGTIETDVGGMHFPAKYTTPEPLTFYSLLEQMVQAGCEYAVMEVSSHGLDQKRVAACRFAVGIFTNLTQDHLDYHKTMEAYYQAKKSLFTLCDKAAVNIDDVYGKQLLSEIDCESKSFSTKLDEADYTAKSISMRADGTSFAFVGSGLIARVKFPVPGEFSVSNAMAAIAACLALGLDLQKTVTLLAASRGVPGRFEVLDTKTPYTVIRDYAHSPDAIEKILQAIRAVTDKKIMILFGCAGNRDRKKRRLMTEAAARLADFVVLTSDNPRNEDPLQIIEDSKLGLLEHNVAHIIIPDRYQAIKWALDNCEAGDTLLLAGKGHEDYQVLAHGTIHFDEREIVAELLEQQTEE